ncbi:MAG: T9SS type A sorting domain-containing protein [Crocinitomix sp.]|nr:T9SS type A sorting domain-containing protein [Crocinitomix sp.]
MKTLATLFLIGFGFNSIYAQDCTEMELDVSSYSVCIGGEITLDATAASGEAIIWDGGIFDDVPFTPEEVGTFIYTATTIDDSDCPLMVEVEVLPFPTVIPGAGDENFCEDEAIVLSAGGDADEYSWDPLDLSPGVGTHTYTLTGVYYFGCSSSATLEITVHALPEIIASVDVGLTCLGNDVVFTVSGAETYVWEDPAIKSGAPYTTTVAGTTSYFVTGTDINGCVGTGSVELDVADAIEITGTPNDEVTGDDGSIDISITGGVPAYMVDWDNDGTGDFDDPASIGGLAGGTYTVIVQGSMGCADTATFTVNSQLSVTSFNITAINVYPNPTVSLVNIELAGSFSYLLLTAKGEVVLSGSGFNKEAVDMETFANGVYYFKIESKAENTTIRVVKK